MNMLYIISEDKQQLNHTIMTTQSDTLTPEKISNDILSNHPSVREFDLCGDNEVFIDYSKKFRKNIRSFVRYYDRNGDAKVVYSTNNTALNLVIELIKKKAISKSDARQISGEPCDKCGGLGFLSHYAHVENGLCFKCNGTGS